MRFMHHELSTWTSDFCIAADVTVITAWVVMEFSLLKGLPFCRRWHVVHVNDLLKRLAGMGSAHTESGQKDTT